MHPPHGLRILFGLALILGLGCGGKDGGSGSGPPPISLQVTPAAVQVAGEESQSFQALVSGGPDPGVAWSVVEGSAGGSITAGGLYTAPSSPGDFHIQATAKGSPAITAQAAVKVVGRIAVTIVPASVNLGPGATQAFLASVQNAADPRVTWSSSGGSIDASGLFAAPAIPGTYSVRATSVQNSSRFATAVAVVTAPLQVPAIASFTATPAVLTLGQSTELAWTVSGATALNISGLGPVTGSSVSATPLATTTFTLTAGNAAGTVTAATTVTVNPAPQPPAILSFTALPARISAGQSTTLAWNVVGAAALDISGLGPVTGHSVSASPPATTTYTLTARNPAGSMTAAATVTVQPAPPPPVIASFLATPATIASGQTSTLSWKVSDATALSLAPGIGPIEGTSLTVAPTVTTTYLLTAANAAGSQTATATLTVQPPDGPPAGNPDGHFPVPLEAQAEDVSAPTQVIGTGTPESCTAEAFIQAVARGGRIVFNGGLAPFTLTLDRPAKVFNDKPDLVIDGGGLVTLSGGGTTRILYMNTCDPNQVWTTSHCQDQDRPRLTVQNLTFANGNSTRETTYDGGGAIWVRGGRFKVVNCRFFNNVCASLGPDVGGGAIRVFSQYHGLPVYVVNSTFGGAPGLGNIGANGGGISSIGVSWAIYNSLFSHNQAIGDGGNPARPGTPGGGSGGAIYNDGNSMTLALFGTLVQSNTVNAHGAAIFFVSNDHSGLLHIEDSVIRSNTGGSWYTLPGISMHSDTRREIINSVIE